MRSLVRVVCQAWEILVGERMGKSKCERDPHPERGLTGDATPMAPSGPRARMCQRYIGAWRHVGEKTGDPRCRPLHHGQGLSYAHPP